MPGRCPRSCACRPRCQSEFGGGGGRAGAAPCARPDPATTPPPRTRARSLGKMGAQISKLRAVVEEQERQSRRNEELRHAEARGVAGGRGGGGAGRPRGCGDRPWRWPLPARPPILPVCAVYPRVVPRRKMTRERGVERN